jgi:hypothetical protein
MVETRTTPGEPPMSPALRRAIAADTIGCFVDLAVLGEADVAVLKRILERPEVEGVEISLKRALGALARSDPSSETAKLLARVLGDTKHPLRERAIAAAFLALLPPEAAEDPLLAALPEAAGLLRLEIIKSLGEVGTEKALAALRRIPTDPHDLAARQIAVAKLAIAFRTERDGTGPDDLDRTLDIRWETLEAKRLAPKEVRSTVAALGPTFGVRPNPEIGFGYDCGAARHVLLLNERVKPGEFVKAIRARNMIAGLLVAQAERLRYFAVRWLLLTSPGRDGVRMVLARPNGEPAFEGRARPKARGLDFTLRDTGLERTPTEIEGRITPDDVTWTMRIWRGPLRGKLRPRQITDAARTGPRAREPVKPPGPGRK